MLHITLTDAASGVVLVDRKAKMGGAKLRKDAQRLNEHGVLYADIEVWAGKLAQRGQHLAVYVSWVCGTNTDPGAEKPANRHTWELPAPCHREVGPFIVRAVEE